jgi:hypothetical protein
MSEPEADPFEVAKRYALTLVETSRNLYAGVRHLANTASRREDAGDVEEALHDLVDDFLEFRAALRDLDDPLAPIRPVDRALTRVREGGPFCCPSDGTRFLNAHRAAEDIAASLRTDLTVGLRHEANASSFWEIPLEGDPPAPPVELPEATWPLLEAFARWHEEVCELVLSEPEAPDIALDIEWESLQARDRFPHLVEGFGGLASPEASVLPSGVNATEVTPPACPQKVRSTGPPPASHRWATLSFPADARNRPSGENATDQAGFACLARRVRSASPGTPPRHTLPRSVTTASDRPSGAKATCEAPLSPKPKVPRGRQEATSQRRSAP